MPTVLQLKMKLTLEQKLKHYIMYLVNPQNVIMDMLKKLSPLGCIKLKLKVLLNSGKSNKLINVKDANIFSIDLINNFLFLKLKPKLLPVMKINIPL